MEVDDDARLRVGAGGSIRYRRPQHDEFGRSRICYSPSNAVGGKARPPTCVAISSFPVLSPQPPDHNSAAPAL
jgi:hypothetical protein